MKDIALLSLAVWLLADSIRAARRDTRIAT
jgi:hypothetical protein